jgi:Bifunctional DNA primase/polymerase, N-terminal/Primase C terminal 1 (PriCT-1)
VSELSGNGGGGLLEAAVAYATAGIPVLPLHSARDGVCSCGNAACDDVAKHPRTEHGLKDATADVQRVAAWWERWPDASIGIPTGEPSGFVVLDVDPRHGGNASLDRLQRQHGRVSTARVLTGSGGAHHWFRRGDTGIRNSAGQVGDGLDVRGDGGYVVAPPSIHASGNPYRWMRPLEDATDVPDWLRATERRNGTTAAKLDEVIPEGKRRAAMLQVAGKLKRAGLSGDEIIPTLRKLNERCRPPLDEAELVTIAYPSTIAVDPVAAIPTVREVPECALDEVVDEFRKWLHLPDPGALYVTLATVAANRMPGDPVWLLLVAASSSGKTEILGSTAGLPEVEPAATLTEAALLSGVPRKDHAKGATGGLLRKIGDYGILTLKDFGSVLSMHREARAAALAALREVYDGSWDRPVGADGGKTLHWDGKCGLIAGVTSVVDRHHVVMDALGSRFAMYRVDVGARDEQTRRSLSHLRSAATMRAALRDVVAGFFQSLELPHDTGQHQLSHDDIERLVLLSDFVTLARSPVERDGYTREVELVPDPEAPARFAGMLAAILEGLRAVGLDDRDAWPLVVKVAFDSMPAQRRKVLELLADADTITKRQAAEALGLPTTPTGRTLEDLAAHGVLVRESGGEGKADVWRLDPEKRHAYTAAARSGGFPETSQSPSSKNTQHVYDDISGEVPRA